MRESAKRYLDSDGRLLLTIAQTVRRMDRLPRRELFIAHYAPDFPKPTIHPETGAALYPAEQVDAWVQARERGQAFREAGRADRKQTYLKNKERA